MTTADLAAVQTLEQELFPLDAWPPEMFAAELAQPVCRYWVAEQDGAVIGYAGLMCIPPVGDVQTIAVVPGHEGRGIGTALLRTLHEHARGLGADRMMLEVRADNPRAQQLYRRHGYEQIHVRPGYYRDGGDALVMCRPLGPEGPADPAGAAGPVPEEDAP